MAISRRTGGNRIPDWADQTKTGGQVLDSGPYVGVIKNNLDPTRSGRLQVYIPNLGGDENEIQNWRTVVYASPFFGSTFQPEATEITSHDKVHHTYGMWAIPPDIGNEVLCTFKAATQERVTGLQALINTCHITSYQPMAHLVFKIKTLLLVHLLRIV